MNKLYQAKHELWLSILFASFAIGDKQIKRDLYNFSTIEFRHMKWVGDDILKNGGDYDYDRSKILEKGTSVFNILDHLLGELKETVALYASDVLGMRMKTDEEYMISYITALLDNKDNDAPITAFDMHRTYEDKYLPQEQVDALTMFLFEESYKEYELILVYSYMQAKTNDILHFNVFQDLIDESHFHLQSFGEMMAKMGILALPRELHELTYKITDIEKFIINGIAEEEAAKEMCRSLSDAIKDDGLKRFFDFINYQENYHIELMKRLLP
ncbi:iron-binding protein [Sulfurimonas sp. HSL-1716]|uniref:iron-binding protein n=1 Tax=Hydrocurvibacter sulfurireducens TaxID=3131937 RepID=UPI0031F88CB7